MQTTFLTLLLAAASQVTAQALPACADTCVKAQLSKFNCASELDFGCVCTPAFNAAVTPCVLSSCNAQDVATTSSLNGAACAAYAARRASGSSPANLLATTTGYVFSLMG
ncbi:hypothetical protein BCR37DRAFT_378704 [Protomyces lactucae-debilis]|uniref:CFEM domain-containing protein n=1 Tax=Protomyces lactucae-debilis TaxID=2754530 RepID=A0A1Y2FIH1_PROLT|nr:uncharacterized protein BCR37DRAFT_378704 [Protomyces lactucae-debilis]ORY83738.1 hypothetical protein BCR37DRAFT_378704 [Protomyces lactucae-debilis]